MLDDKQIKARDAAISFRWAIQYLVLLFVLLPVMSQAPLIVTLVLIIVFSIACDRTWGLIDKKLFPRQ